MSTRAKLKKKIVFHPIVIHFFVCVQNYHPLFKQTMNYLYAKSAKWAQIPYFSHNDMEDTIHIFSSHFDILDAFGLWINWLIIFNNIIYNIP